MNRAEPLATTFRFCPRCGTEADHVGAIPFQCRECDFRFFFGPVAAVGGIVEDRRGRVVLIRRGHDPGKGMLGMPGGFVDAGESVEEALRREIAEEIGLQVERCSYLATFPNAYNHRGVVAPVIDVFYVCSASSFDDIVIDPEEVEHHHVCVPGPAELQEMAFDSNRKAMELYLKQRRDAAS